MSFDLKQISKAISDFAANLNLNIEKVAKSEEDDQFLFFEENLPKSSFENLSESQLVELISTLGDSVVIEFHRSVKVSEFRNGIDISDELAKLKNATQDAASATFQWSIDKPKLLEMLALPSSQNTRYILFLFASNFQQLLFESLLEPELFEKRIWNSVDCLKAVILICDDSFSATGEFVEIHGESTTKISHIVVPDLTRLEILKQQFDSCKNSVRWEYEWLEFATPARFVLSSKDTDREIFKVFAALATNVSLLFTADRVRNPNGDIYATFATEKSRCDIPFVNKDDVRKPAFSVNHCWEVVDLANWAYGDKWEPDRLRFVQLAVANALASEKNRNSIELLWRAKGVRENLNWQWKSFMSERVDQYSAEERTLESEVAETVERVDSQVSELIKGISGTVLGAVGVFIGTFIAAAFNDKFNNDLFIFGITAYAIYVFVFPGIYNMSHKVQAYLATIRLYENRRIRLEQVLGKDKTELVVRDDVTKAQARFKIWLALSIVALVGILIGCYYAGKKVPKLYEMNGPDVKQIG